MSNFIENPDTVIARNRGNSISAGSTIRFPVSEDIPYLMVMSFKEYNYRENIGLETANYTQKKDNGTIVLPLPLQLRDSTGIEASTVSGDTAAMLATVGDKWQAGHDAQSNMRYYTSMIQKLLEGAAIGVASSKNDKAAAIAAGLGVAASAVGVFTGTNGSLISGQAINPFETMEFKGVKLRSHAFSWRLSPSSSDDSDALVKIVNEIKKNMLPKYVAAGGPAALAHALLQYPNIAMITFLGINQNYYYRLKPCMITGFDVRYNSGDQLNVFKGGKPVVAELSLELSELQIHTSEDYGGDPITGTLGDQISGWGDAVYDALGITTPTSGNRNGPRG